jgi:lipid-A-disaccharide synthase-like uncharacterized protein
MNTLPIVTWSFVISLVFELIGAFMKIMHLPGADAFLIVGIVANVLFIISALSEVWGSQRINSNEKIMWTLAFIFMGFLGALAGLIYVLLARKRVTRKI